MAHATLGFLAFLEMPQPICFWQAIALVLSDEAGDRVNQLETYAPSRVAGDERPRRRLDAALQRCIDAAALQWIGWFSTLLGDQVVTLWTFWVHIAIGSVTGGDNGGDARCDGFVGCCRGCCVGRCCSPPRTKMELPFSCGGNIRIGQEYNFSGAAASVLGVGTTCVGSTTTALRAGVHMAARKDHKWVERLRWCPMETTAVCAPPKLSTLPLLPHYPRDHHW
jgi:hypothetical protein